MQQVLRIVTILLSRRALAENVGLSDNTELRFCRTCGFSVYLDFKTSLVPQIIARSRSIYTEVSERDSIGKKRDSIAENIAASIRQTYDAVVEDDVNTVASIIAASFHAYIVGLAASHHQGSTLLMRKTQLS